KCGVIACLPITRSVVTGAGAAAAAATAAAVVVAVVPVVAKVAGIAKVGALAAPAGPGEDRQQLAHVLPMTAGADHTRFGRLVAGQDFELAPAVRAVELVQRHTIPPSCQLYLCGRVCTNSARLQAPPRRRWPTEPVVPLSRARGGRGYGLLQVRAHRHYLR